MAKIIKRLIFVVEILLLLVVLGGLYLYSQVTTKMETIEQPVLKESEIVVNDQAPTMTGYKTYALFGIDHRDKNAALSGENTDTMIIASVNNDTKDVKLVSLYRDTLLNIGNDTYSKANAAYAMGGPEQAITMLNTNLDLDIDDYATVDFNALTTVAECLNGLDMPLSYAEMVHLNNYSVEVSEETGMDYTPLELPETPPEDQEAIYGTYHLNGVQVTSYCRIRYTASLDMGRTERQRRVIQMLVSQAKTASLSTLFDIMDQVFPMVTTSVTQTELLSMLPSLLGYSLDDTTGFPQQYKFSNVKGSIIVCTDLVGDVEELHRFLYDDEDYVASDVVKERAAKILKIVDGSTLTDESTATTEENTTDDVFIYQDTSSETYTEDTYEDTYTDTTGGDTNTDYTDTTGGDTGYTDNTGGDTGYTDNTGGDADYTDNTGGEDYDTGGDYDAGGDYDTGGDYDGGGEYYDDGGGDIIIDGGGDEAYEGE